MTICWHYSGKPFCGCTWSLKAHEYQLIDYGQCKSGTRWFWAAADQHGRADTKEEALRAARAAVRKIASGPLAPPHTVAGLSTAFASRRLKEISAEKRKARNPSGGQAAAAVEYLYGTIHTWLDDGWNTEIREVVPFRITKKTPKRIYYTREGAIPWADADDIGYIDRQDLESDGVAYQRSRRNQRDYRLYESRERAEAVVFGEQAAEEQDDLRELRQAMAKAHPDRGGTSEGFIAARKRYEDALKKARVKSA